MSVIANLVKHLGFIVSMKSSMISWPRVSFHVLELKQRRNRQIDTNTWKHWLVRVLQTADVQILSHALCMVVHHFPAHSYDGSSVLQSRSGAGTLTLYNRHIKWRSVHTRSWTYYTYYVISGFNIYGKSRQRVMYSSDFTFGRLLNCLPY